MKTSVLTAIFIVSMPSFVSSKIVNGYEKDIATARTSLQSLVALPDKRATAKKIEAVREYIIYYELTRILLDQFKIISPGLYHQIDTLTDFKGRPVDVHVKFGTASLVGAGMLASTNVNQLIGDEHGYFSEYGQHTVSVKILTQKNSLLILAHEFGHVCYQVPNLAAYVDFFSRQYRDRYMRASYLGHKPNDRSGQCAADFERKFREENFKFMGTVEIRYDSPIVVRDSIADKVDQQIHSGLSNLPNYVNRAATETIVRK